MYEFKNTSWAGLIVQYNYAKNNDPRNTGFATACLTNGCTHHKTTTLGTALYDIELRRDLVRLAAGHSFWCPFTLGQVIENLEDIAEVVPMEFAVEETAETFKIHLEISNSFSGRVHFYVLTRVRYLYEFPQCALFNDVYKLKALDRFSGWDLQSLYGLVVSSIPVVRNTGNEYITGRSSWYDPYHSIPLNYPDRIPVRLGNEDLKKKNLQFSTLNSIYGSISKVPVKIEFDKELFSSLAYWRDKEGFEMRLPYYLENATLYDDPKKNEAGKVTLDYYEETKKAILATKIDLLRRDEANIIVQKDYSRRRREIDEKVKELGQMTFNELHPRDEHGRFKKKVVA
jgi:hypothetical protein